MYLIYKKITKFEGILIYAITCYLLFFSWAIYGFAKDYLPLTKDAVISILTILAMMFLLLNHLNVMFFRRGFRF